MLNDDDKARIIVEVSALSTVTEMARFYLLEHRGYLGKCWDIYDKERQVKKQSPQPTDPEWWRAKLCHDAGLTLRCNAFAWMPKP